MAGTWRVNIESLSNLQRASWRPGDGMRKVKHSLISDGADADLRNLVVEVSVLSSKKVARTRAFHVPENGNENLVLNEVLFIPEPRHGEGVVVSIIKLHKHQSDALVGEAVVYHPTGHQTLDLTRKATFAGQISLSMTSGLPSRPDAHSAPSPSQQQQQKQQQQQPALPPTLPLAPTSADSLHAKYKAGPATTRAPAASATGSSFNNCLSFLQRAATICSSS
ncbi:unnamed protein product [Polarella glacialis]|uniref:Uncharacterized protein n=1 Tax=Polarella glacialis TaxID=89957 RepID=A0A813EZD4_POLGL|nr:unnamed protein product [Polarella glacialis]CAE8607217.1 unnamed protein product [Polarella glacialis]CAE8682409.1 unnamed protein product [Polarella glacialis]